MAPRESNPHNDGGLKPEVVPLIGKTYQFTLGWEMGENDPYPGEAAYIPDRDQGWPEEAPTWVASGDLQVSALDDTITQNS